MTNSTEKALVDFIQAERNIYAQCPNCEEIYRLNEFKIFHGATPPQDLLDQLRLAEEEFEAKKKKIVEQAIEKSKVTYIGNTLEHLAPTTVKWGHHPRDCRFLGAPIDYISFDGYFTDNKVNKITFVEVKTGNADLTPKERSIKKAVENGNVHFEEFRIET